MTNENNLPNKDILDRALEALRNDPLPTGPTDQLAASTIEALRTATFSPEVLRLQQRRKIMFRIARYGSVATAATVLVAVGLAFFMNRESAFGFGDVVQNIQKAKSVSFNLKQKLTPQSPTLNQKWFLQGDGMRMEMPGIQEGFRRDEPIIMAIIANLKEKKALQIDYIGKTAKWQNIEKNMDKAFANPIDQLRKLKDQDAERIDDEKLDGKTMRVYRLKKLDFLGGKGPIEEGESAKVWVDPKNGLPVRIAIEGWNADHKGKMHLVFDQFTWNENYSPEMFALEVPKGFTEGPEPEAPQVR